MPKWEQMNSVVSFEVAPTKLSRLVVCFAVRRPAQGGAPAELEPQAAIKSVAPTKTRDNRTRATHIRTLRLRITAAVVTGDAKLESAECSERASRRRRRGSLCLRSDSLTDVARPAPSPDR